VRENYVWSHVIVVVNVVVVVVVVVVVFACDIQRHNPATNAKPADMKMRCLQRRLKHQLRLQQLKLKDNLTLMTTAWHQCRSQQTELFSVSCIYLDIVYALIIRRAHIWFATTIHDAHILPQTRLASLVYFVY